MRSCAGRSRRAATRSCRLLFVLALGALAPAQADEPPPADAPPADPAQRAALLKRTLELDLRMRASMRAGRTADALAPARESLAISERLLKPADGLLGIRQGNLGGVLFELGRLEESRPLLVSALASAERVWGPDGLATVAALNNVANLHQSLGEYARARPLFERVIDIRERVAGAQHLETVDARVKLALLLADMGALDEAESLAGAALRRTEALAGPEAALTGLRLRTLGDILRKRGRYEQALPLLARALAIHERTPGPESSEAATSASRLAHLLDELGRYEASRPLHERGVAIAEKVHGPSHPATAHALGNLGLVLGDLGQHEAALTLHRRDLALLEAVLGPEHPELTVPLGNLAGAYDALGDLASARPLYERALAVIEKAKGPAHLDTAACVGNLAHLLLRMGEAEAALPLHERALTITAAVLGEEHPDTGRCANNVAVCLQRLGRLEQAQALQERAFAIAERVQGPDHPETAQRCVNLAMLALRRGDVKRAAALFQDGLERVERHLREQLVGAQGPERVLLARMARRVLDAFEQEAPRLGLSGYAEALRFKGLVTRLEALDRRVAQHSGPAVRAQVEEVRAVLRQLGALSSSVPRTSDAEGRQRWQAQYVALTARRAELSRAITQAVASSGAGGSGREPGLAEVQAALPPQAVLCDALRIQDRYLAWVVSGTGSPTRVDLGSATALEAAAQDFSVAAAREGPAADPALAVAGARLSELVLAPLLVHVPPGTQTLILSPDAALAAVPFAALPVGAKGRTLLDAHALLVLVASAHDVLPNAARRGSLRPRRGATLLVGGVDFDAAPEEGLRTPTAPPAAPGATLAPLDRAPRGARFRPLPGTLVEVQALGAWFAGSEVLTGSAATEGALRDRSGGTQRLHIATHGFVRTDLTSALAPRKGEARWLGGREEARLSGYDPMLLAGLALAGANPRQGGGGDDGILTALEASHLDLRSCDLVVLSACETALGRVESGEGVLGLVQGFQLAGAGAVVASLWKVDDRATALLMQRFYDALPRAGTSGALREAALWLRDAKPGGRDLSAPRYWAAFVAYERR